MSNWKSLIVIKIKLMFTFKLHLIRIVFKIELKDILTKENSDLLNQIEQQKSNPKTLIVHVRNQN
jgi:hypothetical protein